MTDAISNFTGDNLSSAVDQSSVTCDVVVVVVLLFYVHGKHLRSCRDGQFITLILGRLRPPKR